jgi:site-specific DNA-methyltransferase (adenine-specific)
MNTLYYGDNLTVLREHIRDESVDLVYLDPPFNSQATYNVLFRAPTGEHSQAQIAAFEDTWHWNETAEQAFDEVVQSGNMDAAEMLRAMRAFLKENDMMAYLTMMAIRLLELHRVLKPTGSIYLHCDPTASHYLKILLDVVFEPQNFRNEIIWKRTSSHNDAKRFADVCDYMLYYGRSKDIIWNSQYQGHNEQYLRSHYNRQTDDGRSYRLDNIIRSASMGPRPNLAYEYKGYTPPWGWRVILPKLQALDACGRLMWVKGRQGGTTPYLVRFLDEQKGAAMPTMWDDIPPVNSQAQERLGYPTQKPEALLERILHASSNEGDTVLDPFCGCGTAIHAAQKLGRNWLGIDITHLAISLIEKRLNDAFPGIEYEVHGTPKDVEGAKALADHDKYQFQWWAVSLVHAVPYGGKKKGADSGIDGIIYFKPDGKHTEKAIVSVKGGANVSAPMIRDLAHVVDREQAKVGVFLTLACPTRPMQTEATKAGWYTSPHHGKLPKIQILTIADLLAGKHPQLPFRDPATWRRARPEAAARQGQLL